MISSIVPYCFVGFVVGFVVFVYCCSKKSVSEDVAPAVGFLAGVVWPIPAAIFAVYAAVMITWHLVRGLVVLARSFMVLARNFRALCRAHARTTRQVGLPTATARDDGTRGAECQEARERLCPVCQTSKLDAPGHCPTCGTIRLFKIEQSRIIQATYEREIWARSDEQAVERAEQGTAWPQSYDERRGHVHCGPWSVKDVTSTGIHRDEGGYSDDD